jgi:hypothetical protein
MNQKSIFTAMGLILVIQGIAFYAWGTDVVTRAFPDLDETGKMAPTVLMQVMGVMSVLIGLIAFAARNTAQVVWAFCLGFVLFSVVSLKHLLVDHIQVPIPAIIIQIAIVLCCAYVWMQGNKQRAS